MQYGIYQVAGISSSHLGAGIIMTKRRCSSYMARYDNCLPAVPYFILRQVVGWSGVEKVLVSDPEA
jgi:hypothetical protein